MPAINEAGPGRLVREGGGCLTMFGLPFLVVKTRKGLTTFGEGLTDDEIQYLHAIVRRALAGTYG